MLAGSAEASARQSRQLRCAQRATNKHCTLACEEEDCFLQHVLEVGRVYDRSCQEEWREQQAGQYERPLAANDLLGDLAPAQRRLNRLCFLRTMSVKAAESRFYWRHGCCCAP